MDVPRLAEAELEFLVEGASWYVLNHPPEALQHLTTQPVFSGDDCPFETLAPELS